MNHRDRRAFEQKLQNLRQQLDQLRADTQQGMQTPYLAELTATVTQTHAELQTTVTDLQRENADLRRAYLEASAERQRYRELFEFAPQGYLVTDLDGTIEDANAAIANLLQVERTLLSGRQFFTFVTEADRAALTERCEALGDGESDSCNLYLQRWDGETFPGQLVVTRVRGDRGQPVGYRWLLNDRSEIVAAQRDLQRERERNQLRGRFLDAIAEEYRTPLSNILTSLQLLERRGGLSARAAMLLHSIRSSTRTMHALLEDMLIFRRTESDRPRLCRTLVNAEEFCTQVAAASDKTRVRYHRQCDNAAICLDGHLLRYALESVLSNALQFSTEPVDLTLLRAGEQLALCVSDRGDGIPPEEQPHIFEPFFRGRNAQHAAGVGLGLAIARRAIEALGGTISLDSATGVGTTVYLTVPVSE